jgi:hypothetical protein
MMKMKSLLFGLLTGAFFIGAASAQTGQLGSGQVWGNPGAAQGVAIPSSISAILDRSLGSTRGAILERGSSGWAIVGPGSTSGIPFISNGTGADPGYAALPISGIGGLGTGVGTALGVNIGTAGAFVVNGGALGTPSSGVATNLTGAATGLTAGHVTTNANLTGDITSTGNATTLTNAPVIAKVLTGFTSGAGAVSAADSILSALQKINGNDALKLPLAGGTMSGPIALGGNNISGVGTITASTYSGLPNATNSVKGVSEGDGTTISCSAGVCSAIGTLATSIDAAGATSISNSGASNNVLFNNSGKVGSSLITTLINSACTLSPSSCGFLFGYVSPAWLGTSGSAQSTTGTISASSTALTLASALDFKNGQGIRINHAGTASGLVAATGLTVTAIGTTGSTTYGYTIMPFTAAGGYGPDCPGVGIGNGNATLSATNFNALSWTAVSGAVGYAVYGNVGAGPFVLLAFVPGTTFHDTGTTAFPSQTAPDWMPSTPLTSAAANWLVTTVSSGGGTTSLTLAAAATTTATSQTALHDDTIALQAALTSADSADLPLNFSNGIYRISAALTGSGPLNIYGSGANCCGLAPSTIALSSPTQDVFDITGNYIAIHDLNFEGGGGTSSGQVAGSLINFTTGSGAVWVNRVNSQFAFNGVSCMSGAGCGPFYISDNLLNGYAALINVTNGGDSQYYANALSPISVPGATSGIGIFMAGDPGGAKIFGNKINAGSGYTFGIQVRVDASDGDMMIFGNSIEGYNNTGIEIDRGTGSPSFGNVSINSNQLAAGGGAIHGINFSSTVGSWMSNATVTGNIISNAGANAGAISMGATNQFVVEGNSISNSVVGIRVESAATGCMIGPNVFNNVTAVQVQDASAACSYAAITPTAPMYP